MTVGDLIDQKDYDYISWHIILPESVGGGHTFFGACQSENGKLIPLDGDSYSRDTEVISYEEWSKGDIKNGLTVVCDEGCLIIGGKKHD